MTNDMMRPPRLYSDMPRVPGVPGFILRPHQTGSPEFLRCPWTGLHTWRSASSVTLTRLSLERGRNDLGRLDNRLHVYVRQRCGSGVVGTRGVAVWAVYRSALTQRQEGDA